MKAPGAAAARPASSRSGLLIAFEGLDGCGKSTQLERCARWLAGRQATPPLRVREPGGTPLGEAVRALLLAEGAITPQAEMLLYMAARAQLVEEVIRPALATRKIVISDRFLLANVVYQGHAGGLDPSDVWNVGQVAVSGVLPRLVFVLDMPAQRAASRIQRAADRMEAQGLDYLEAVRQGFLAEARRLPDQIVVIDADRPAEDVHRDVLRALEPLLR